MKGIIKGNYDLWLMECERNNSELYLLENYKDKKNIVKLFKVVKKYEYKHNYYNDVIYCLWDNDKMIVSNDYIVLLNRYRNITNKYIEKKIVKGNGSYTERSVVK